MEIGHFRPSPIFVDEPNHGYEEYILNKVKRTSLPPQSEENSEKKFYKIDGKIKISIALQKSYPRNLNVTQPKILSHTH